MMDEDTIFSNVNIELAPNPPTKRVICDRCKRPVSVCWCPFLPDPPPNISTQVIVLQHPFELKRCLSTTPMLYHGLPNGKCEIIHGSRFDITKHPVLQKALNDDNCILLFPSSDAVPVTSLPYDKTYNLIVLDGTWEQAKGLLSKNKFLQSLKKVKVDKPPISKYVVRTQPTDECVSTLESVALTLEVLEQRAGLFEMLTRPLQALCDFQLSHGAVVHQSKEYLIRNGLHKSQKTTQFEEKS